MTIDTRPNVAVARPQLDEFTAAARTFLDANAGRRASTGTTWGIGDDALSPYVRRTAAEEHQRIADGRRWKQVEFDGGFGWITGPPALGGAGLSAEYERRYVDLRRDYDVPSVGMYGISLGMVAPAILDH